VIIFWQITSSLSTLAHVNVYIDANQINQASSRIEQMGKVEKDLRNKLEAMRLIAEVDGSA
jgi:hypothetical protein